MKKSTEKKNHHRTIVITNTSLSSSCLYRIAKSHTLRRTLLCCANRLTHSLIIRHVYICGVCYVHKHPMCVYVARMIFLYTPYSSISGSGSNSIDTRIAGIIANYVCCATVILLWYVKHAFYRTILFALCVVCFCAAFFILPHLSLSRYCSHGPFDFCLPFSHSHKQTHR